MHIATLAHSYQQSDINSPVSSRSRRGDRVVLIGLVVVFRGWELVFCDAVQR